ncbi:MAG: hypothetical protein IJU79_07275 [Desulfovibrionaceae bacterium]|nr:hypothetical protein [Desulfovibrionaceae bacterium]
MALAYNHGSLAAANPKNLNVAYSHLLTSTERLAISLWVNFAFHETTNLAIKELMRTDIASLQQELISQSNCLSFLGAAKPLETTHAYRQNADHIKNRELRELSSNPKFQDRVAEIEAIIAATKAKQNTMLPTISYNANEYPNIDYIFDFEIEYTGNAKIISEAYAINKLMFQGSEATFEFKKGVSTVTNQYYPHVKIINEHHELKAGSIYYTYELNFENQDTSDIKYTATFDCPDFDISGFKFSYSRSK